MNRRAITLARANPLVPPWWCALFHRTQWEVEQAFEKPDYPFMKSTSRWCPKCEERRTPE